MTQDELIDLAKQANGEPAWSGGVDWTWQELEVFAKLVAAKEREAIKALAQKELLNTNALMSMPPQSSAAWNILNAIQARGQHE